jgi:integrase
VTTTSSSATPTRGAPVDTSKLAKCYLKPALKRAGIEKRFRPFHDLRHTLTHAAAAGNPTRKGT